MREPGLRGARQAMREPGLRAMREPSPRALRGPRPRTLREPSPRPLREPAPRGLRSGLRDTGVPALRWCRRPRRLGSAKPTPAWWRACWGRCANPAYGRCVSPGYGRCANPAPRPLREPAPRGLRPGLRDTGVPALRWCRRARRRLGSPQATPAPGRKKASPAQDRRRLARHARHQRLRPRQVPHQPHGFAHRRVRLGEIAGASRPRRTRRARLRDRRAARPPASPSAGAIRCGWRGSHTAPASSCAAGCRTPRCAPCRRRRFPAPAASRLPRPGSRRVAHRREPTSAPSAPSTRAAASVRPSAMPPAASSSTCGACAASQSASSGTKAMVARPFSASMPWPPASPPCATITAAPASMRLRHLRHALHLADQRGAAARDARGVGPRIAERQHHRAGRCSSAQSSADASSSSFQVMKPQPMRSRGPRSSASPSRAASRPGRRSRRPPGPARRRGRTRRPARRRRRAPWAPGRWGWTGRSGG